MKSVSEFYIVAFDIEEGDVPTLAIAKPGGTDVDLVNIIHGDEVLDLYTKLTKNKID